MITHQPEDIAPLPSGVGLALGLLLIIGLPGEIRPSGERITRAAGHQSREQVGRPCAGTALMLPAHPTAQ